MTCAAVALPSKFVTKIVLQNILFIKKVVEQVLNGFSDKSKKREQSQLLFALISLYPSFPSYIIDLRIIPTRKCAIYPISPKADCPLGPLNKTHIWEIEIRNFLKEIDPDFLKSNIKEEAKIPT